MEESYTLLMRFRFVKIKPGIMKFLKVLRTMSINITTAYVGLDF